MNKTLTTISMALLGGAWIPFSSVDGHLHEQAARCAVATPIPGPGGVAMAVEAWLDAQGDPGKLGGHLLDSVGDVEFVYVDGALKTAPKGSEAKGAEAKGAESKGAESTGAESTGAFFDVDSLGKPIAAAKAKDFVALVKKRIATSKADRRVVAHRMHAVRANCHSEACSQAFVDFTRIYTIGGGKQMHVPMRATVLLRYDEAAARFVISHWHASRAE